MPRAGLEAIETKPLLRIPSPPQSYIELKCTMHGIPHEQRQATLDKFYNAFKDYAGEIKEYSQKLIKIRNHNIAYAEIALMQSNIQYHHKKEFEDSYEPIERFTEDDPLEAQHFYWGLIIDFDFYRSTGKLLQAKTYIILWPRRLFL